MPLKIAILGTRGVPANYGGFETFAEELSHRLAARGHSVVVYCRSQHSEPTYRGVTLKYLPTIRHKYLDTIVHTGLSTLHLMGMQGADIALYCNAANAIFTWMPRMTGCRVLINVDGLERKRKKWNWMAKRWYRMSERWSTWFPNKAVSDARAIARYYRSEYKADTAYIPYGAPTGKVASTVALEKLGLEPGEYFLYVTRFEPENNPLLVRESFQKLQTEKKLALIGDAPYAHEYIQKVRATSDPRVVMPGSIYGDGYHELQSHCLAYVHATEVGGTHPALIEAMGRGCVVLYLKTIENDEVAGGVGIPFHPGNLTEKMQSVLAMSAEEREALGQKAMARVASRYNWDAVTDAYERLFLEILSE